ANVDSLSIASRQRKSCGKPPTASTSLCTASAIPCHAFSGSACFHRVSRGTTPDNSLLPSVRVLLALAAPAAPHPRPSLLAEDEVHDPATAHVRAGAAAMVEEVESVQPASSRAWASAGSTPKSRAS